MSERRCTPCNPCCSVPPPIQNPANPCHVHEVVGSVMVAEEWENDHRLVQEEARGAGESFSAPDAAIGRRPRPEPEQEAHNHRFATVSGPPIPIPGGHVHEVSVRTDFYDNHFHFVIGVSGPAVAVGDRHVHFLSGNTTVNEDHSHSFRAASLIDDPIGD